MVSNITSYPSAIIFDWDNTLADTWNIIHASLNVTFEEMGHEPWSFEDVKSGRQNIHKSLRSSFPEIFGDEWEKARDIYYDAFKLKHLDEIQPIFGAEKMLKNIKDKGIYTAIVSNKTGKYLREEVAHLGWESYFNSVVGATDAKRDKPFPDPVHLAINGSKIVLDKNVWFIGDSQVDIECATNTNCLPILWTKNEKNEENYSNYSSVIHILESYQKLIDVIDKVGSEG